jgi:hypothetical protein
LGLKLHSLFPLLEDVVMLVDGQICWQFNWVELDLLWQLNHTILICKQIEWRQRGLDLGDGWLLSLANDGGVLRSGGQGRLTLYLAAIAIAGLRRGLLWGVWKCGLGNTRWNGWGCAVEDELDLGDFGGFDDWLEDVEI